MSNLSPMRGSARPGLPTPPRGDTVASYKTYAEAQRAVDFLSDRHFPVQAVTIVGTGLQMVERVTGRLTYARVAIAGLASGAWFGLFVGLLISFVSSSSSWLAAVPLGAAFGMAFGLFSYALTGGRRDFTSTSQIVAGEYLVLCLAEQAGQAMQLLRQLDGGTGLDAGAGAQPYQPPTSTSNSASNSAPNSAAQQAAPQWGPPAHDSRVPGPPPADRPLTADGTVSSDQPQPDASGPTYGEVIDRKRREEREAAEREAAAGRSDQS